MSISAIDITNALANQGVGGGRALIENGRVVLRHEDGPTIWAEKSDDTWEIHSSALAVESFTPPQSAHEIARALIRAFQQQKPTGTESVGS